MNLGKLAANVRPAQSRQRQRRSALQGLPCLVLAGVLNLAQAQAITSAAGTALPVSNLGESQIEALLQAVQDGSRAQRGVPIPVFRERVLSAVLAHPDVLAARATTASARESVRELEAARLPQVTGRADASSHRTAPSTITGINETRRYETASVAVTLQQSVYDFGATQTAVVAGQERSAAVAARLEGRRDETALRGVQAWHEVVRARRRLALQQLNVQSLESMVSYLNRRYELGGGPVSDVWRAQARLADARASIATAQARVGSAEASFREIFDATPEAIDLPATPELDRRAVAQASADLAREFPSVRSAEASRRAAEQELDLALRRERPNLGFEMTAQRRDIAGRGEPGNDYSAALVLRYSFYSGGADHARAGQAAHRAEEAAEQVRGLILQVDRALAQALATDENVAASVIARREGVTLAVQALRAVREQFANRRGSLLDLLNAQEALHAAGVGLTDTEVDGSLARWQVLYYTTKHWPLAAAAAPQAH